MVSPPSYQQARDQRDEIVLASQDDTPAAGYSNDEDYSRFPPVFEILPPWRLAQLFHTSLIDHNLASHAAVIFLPLLPVPPATCGSGQTEDNDLEESRGYVDMIAQTTESIGPVLLVQAVLNVISVEL
jgi:hypothetical protein